MIAKNIRHQCIDGVSHIAQSGVKNKKLFEFVERVVFCLACKLLVGRQCSVALTF